MGHWALGIGNTVPAFSLLYSLLYSLPLRPSRLRGSFEKSNTVGCEVRTLHLLTTNY